MSPRGFEGDVPLAATGAAASDCAHDRRWGRRANFPIRQVTRLWDAGVPPTFAGVTDLQRDSFQTPTIGDGADTPPQAAPIPWIVFVILAVVAIGGTGDLILDRPTRILSLHVLFELGLILFSLTSLVVLSLQWRRASVQLAGSERLLAATQRSLEERRAERDAWRKSAEGALAGLGEAIERQFAAWGLTPTEGEIALFLLKGFGHKQIAAVTGRSERTVRQHAVAVYQKAGLGGRAELAAFFLQDLMLPVSEERRT